MSTEENKAVLLQADEQVFALGKTHLAHNWIAPDCVDHNAYPGQAPGIEGLQQMAKTMHDAFGDMAITFEQVLADGDTVAARWTVRGTHQGPFLGMGPSGKAISFTGIDVVRIAEGKIVDWWHNEDIAGLLLQLGMLPPPSPS